MCNSYSESWYISNSHIKPSFSLKHKIKYNIKTYNIYGEKKLACYTLKNPSMQMMFMVLQDQYLKCTCF